MQTGTESESTKFRSRDWSGLVSRLQRFVVVVGLHCDDNPISVARFRRVAGRLLSALLARASNKPRQTATAERYSTPPRLQDIRPPPLLQNFTLHCLFKGKGGPYSTAERRVSELIPVLGRQPAGDVSHKPGGKLPSLFARPAITLTTLKRVLPISLLGEQKHDRCEQFA